MTQKCFHVAVIGGGASGALCAVQLLRQSRPIVVHIFNDGFELGRGLAYSGDCQQLVLNVPAGRMSAFPDRPDDFKEWLAARHGTRYSKDSFVPRPVFGDYLRDTLQTAVSDAPAECVHTYNGRVTGLSPKNPGYTVACGDREYFADAVILATGNPPPADPHSDLPGILADPRYISNPWRDPRALRKIVGRETVVILGSGLTAVDMILEFRDQGYAGVIHLISRRGQWPLPHRPGLAPMVFERPQLMGLAPVKLLRRLRQRIRTLEQAGGDWRQVVDGLRPETNAIWAGWTNRQRRSALRHLLPFWNIHRHRMPAEVWQILDREIKSGRVRPAVGRVLAIRPEKAAMIVICRPRGQSALQEISAGYIINCTGPEKLGGESCPPVIRSLLRQNLAQLDPLGLGLTTSPEGALLNAEGRGVPGLYAIGSVRRGDLWETTAIPEIRMQAGVLAREIGSLAGGGTHD